MKGVYYARRKRGGGLDIIWIYRDASGQERCSSLKTQGETRLEDFDIIGGVPPLSLPSLGDEGAW